MRWDSILADKLADLRIMIRGAGEMASGTAYRLHRAGFRNLFMTDIESPLAVRRMVSFSEAIYEGDWAVEGVSSKRIEDPDEAPSLWRESVIPVIVDPEASSRQTVKPQVFVDATLAKKNLGTAIDYAPLVVGMGPGFNAAEDVHYVIETNRGHNLGRLIFNGSASPNTGTPGDIGGFTGQRVLRAPEDGLFQTDRQIGDLVEAGMVVGEVAGAPVNARITGILRGLIRPGCPVTKGLKIGDIDPRCDASYCNTISEKSRAIGGTVLEAVLMKFNTL
jgi:xanthine dehydrogenase accessory factor